MSPSVKLATRNSLLETQFMNKNRDKKIAEREIVIKMKNVNKTFNLKEKNTDTIREKALSIFSGNKKRQLKALDNINLEIRKGEFLGIIGRNGSGKSTLLKVMIGAIRPDKGGIVTTNGRIMRMSLGMGFDPNLSARENVYLNATILGLTFKEIDSKFDEIIDFSELHKFVDTQIKYFSRGMKSRLAFSVAVHADADIFLMDEFFGGVGDANFKQKSEEIFKQSFIDGRTIIHVSHQFKTIRELCDRVILMDKGSIVAIGKPNQVIPAYRKLLNEEKEAAKLKEKENVL